MLPRLSAPQEISDLLCVLLMVRVNADHRKLMAKRRLPILDDYLDRVHLLLWPRFKVGQERRMYYVHAACTCCCDRDSRWGHSGAAKSRGRGWRVGHQRALPTSARRTLRPALPRTCMAAPAPGCWARV
jgi:hypothetical protein